MSIIEKSSTIKNLEKQIEKDNIEAGKLFQKLEKCNNVKCKKITTRKS